MSQFVETRVGDFLGEGAPVTIVPTQPRPTSPTPRPLSPAKPEARPAVAAPALPVPMTSAAARFAVEPPPPVIKRQVEEQPAPKPAEKRPDQIFTF